MARNEIVLIGAGRSDDDLACLAAAEEFGDATLLVLPAVEGPGNE